MNEWFCDECGIYFLAVSDEDACPYCGAPVDLEQGLAHKVEVAR